MKNRSFLPLLAVSAASLVVAPSCSSTPSDPTTESVGSVSERLSTVGIATWKNGATGAYTIHHDDAGSIFTITDFVVPQLNSRGLTAGLGAIAGAVQTNAADQVPKLTAAAAAGHEIMSHSWTHVLQGNTQACPGVTMAGCADGLGGQKEVVDSKTWLEANLNTHVTYFIYPYDYRAADVAALVAQNYLGDRSGWGDQGTAQGVNPADFGDYNDAFETAGLDPIPDGQLNGFVDQIISAGGWGIRELHGVGDNTWGHVTQAQYTAHLDYIKSKRDAGQLWVANPTAAIKYKHVRQGDCGSPQLTGNTLTFSSPNAAACTKYHAVVSVKVTDPTSTLTATQGGQSLEVLNKGSSNWIINMDPTLGAVTVSTGSSCTLSPFNGTHALPGTVQAEDFDNGGAGCAYSDVDAVNNGGAYRTSEQVDMEACTDTGGGFNVGWTAAGEWLKYTVSVTAGTYSLNFRVASSNGVTNAFHMENESGTNLTGSLSVPNTGGWQTWTTVTKTGVALAGGSHVYKLVIDVAGFNFNSFSASGASCTPETDSAFCSRLAKNCGSVTANDNCGTSRTVGSCGSCTSPQTCGGGGNSNVCGGGTSGPDRTEGGSGTGTGTSCNSSTEDVTKLYDNLMTSASFSKWCVTAAPSTTTPISTMYDFSSTGTYAINSYTITTGNDAAGRDPKDWTLQGCQGSCTAGSDSGWVTIDTRTGQFAGAARYQTNTYSFTNGTAYQQIRLRVTANNGDTGTFQMAELQMFGDPGSSCTPESDSTFCSRLAKNCGSVTANDNCGTSRTVSSCGSCTSPQTCGGGGTANVCGTSCTPESNTAFCSRLGKNCDSVTANDNCGASRTVSSCGSCTSPQTCGGGGTANVCGGGGSSTCSTPYAQANCLSYLQGTKVSTGGHNWTCSNGNCANCSGFTSCAPGGTGCPWGTVWTDDGACN